MSSDHDHAPRGVEASHADDAGDAPAPGKRTRARAHPSHRKGAPTARRHDVAPPPDHDGAAPADDPFGFQIGSGVGTTIADPLARFDFALGGSVENVTRLVLQQAPDVRDDLLGRARARRGERFVFAVHKALLLATGHLGGFSWSTAVATLVSRKPGGARAVMRELYDAEPEHRGAILACLDDVGLLDDLLAPLPFAQVEHLHDRMIAHRSRVGASHVLSKLRPYFQNKDRSDHSLSHYLGSVPVVGGALTAVANGATFGFIGQHDAAYRQMRAGLITEDEYDHATVRAAGRAAVVGAVSTVTGGAAGAYAEGVTGGLAAMGTAGRVAAGTLTGAAAGGAGGLGAQLGGDAFDGEASSVGTYAESMGMGALVGGAVGAGGTALLEGLPAGARAWLATKLPRFPEIFEHWRQVGERHALVLKAARLHELIADGAGAWGSPNALAVAGGLAGEVDVRITAELTDRGLSVIKAERLPDLGREGDDLAHLLGDGPEAAGMSVVDGATDAARQRQATTAATRSNVGKRTPLAEHIPPPGPEFIEWWDGLSRRELGALLADRDQGVLAGARRIIEANIRHPGGLHEWLMVKHQLQIKRWGVSLRTVLDARTRTEATIGRRFKHGGAGSGHMHNQLDMLIETSPSFDAFKARLNQWADHELFPVRGPNGEAPAGRFYLPPDLVLP